MGIKSQATPYPTFSEMRDDITDRKITRRHSAPAGSPTILRHTATLYSLYDSESADGKGSNDGDYKNPEFDALIDKATPNPPMTRLSRTTSRRGRSCYKDLPAVPLWYANNKGVAAKNVKGFTLTWQGIEDYRQHDQGVVFAALGPLCPIAFWRRGTRVSTTAGR